MKKPNTNHYIAIISFLTMIIVTITGFFFQDVYVNTKEINKNTAILNTQVEIIIDALYQNEMEHREFREIAHGHDKRITIIEKNRND